MFLFPLACAGGVLTILSLCILPVLPLASARSDQPFVRLHGRVEDRTFQIEFLDPGAQAFAFTFG